MDLKNRILITQAKNGNRLAQKRLYELYAKAMFNTCYRIIGSFETAEDILQEAFVDAFLHISDFDFRVSFGAWLKRIVVNKSINAIRTSKMELAELDENHDNTPQDIDEDLDIEFTVNKVHRAMEQLPDKSRTVFSLYLLEGYDHEEISEILGISVSTSKTQLMRAKLKIREIVKYNYYEN